VTNQYEYEAGSTTRIQPHSRSNARAVDRSTALKIRCSDSDGPCGHCTRPCVPCVGQISRQSSEHPQDRQITRRTAVHREVRPLKATPRARHVVYARDGAGNSRSRCAFASRILGSTDFGSTAIKSHFSFKNKMTSPSWLTLNLPDLASESTTFPGSACRC